MRRSKLAHPLEHGVASPEDQLSRTPQVETPFDRRSGSARDHVLDGLRAVAVLCVIIGHFILFRLASTAPAIPAFTSRAAGSLAVTGVEIFFLISGYVITRLLLRERLRHGRNDLRAFYARRVLRIIPAFYVYLVAIALLSICGYLQTPLTETLSAATFLCNTGLSCSWFVGHTWSLAVEEQFYLVWPSVFVLIFGQRLLSVIVLVVGGLFLFSLVRGFVPFANNMSFLYIAIGALTATSRKLQSTVVKHVGVTVWMAAAALLLAGILLLPDRLMLIGKPLLLAILVFGAGNVKVARTILELRLFQIIGAASYSLYLWQELFLARADAYRAETPPVWLLPAVAGLSWWLIERPGIAAGRAYTRRRQNAVVRPCIQRAEAAVP